MYPHQTDTVQINTPEYNLDIDGDNQPNTHNSQVTVSVQGTLNTSQESSISEDQPPEVRYKRHQIQPSSVDLEIPELEEDSDQDQFADLDNLITHHNTHQESEWI